MPVHGTGQSEFMYPVPMVQKVQEWNAGGLDSKRKAAETGSTHPQWWAQGPSTYDEELSMTLGPWVPWVLCSGKVPPFPCVMAPWEVREHVCHWHLHSCHLVVMENNCQWEGPLRQQRKDKWWEGECAPCPQLQGLPSCVGIAGRPEESTLLLRIRVVRQGHRAKWNVQLFLEMSDDIFFEL